MRKLWIAAALAFTAPALAQREPVKIDPANVARLRSASAEVLFWTQEQRDQNFPHMETIFPTTIVHAGKRVRPLPPGKSLPIAAEEVEAFMAANNVAGLIVVQNGRVRLERYARGLTRSGRWTSFSVAKSFTSTLAGAAIKDGYIKSLQDPVTRYIPELAGSGYDGVTVEQLLTMTSGVKWNEDYTDPNSDVARMFTMKVPAGVDATVAYMRTLPRDTAPGTKWEYKTGETNLVGVLVQRATHKLLSDYLTEKVWKPYGMETDGYWMLDPTGQNIGGCCLSISLRDYARMGQLALEGGTGIVRPGWFADATREHANTGAPGFGYGYQWWTFPDGLFGAIGIFGQGITVDPKHRVVIAMVSANARATSREWSTNRRAFQAKLLAAAVAR